MRFGTVVWSAWAILGMGVILSRVGEHNPTIHFILFIAIFFSPLPIYLYLRNSRATKTVSDQVGFLEIAGSPKYSHFEAETAIALNAVARTITLRLGKAIKIYSYADIREWTSAPAWFHVKVRDIDHPEWRIAMLQKSDRDRWAEIFQQEINERGADARAS